MSETNGQGKSRLDRIEEMIERQERANEAAHVRFQEDDKRLLTAQILMNGAMQKTNEAVDKLMVTVERTNESLERTNESLRKTNESLEKTNEAAKESAREFWKSIETLELKMEETTEKLDALIATVDGIIRRPPDSNLPATGH